jgi:hypothetical protein
MAYTKKEESKEKDDKMCDFNFSEGNFEEWVDMMKKCCPDGKGNFDCCSIMREKMDEMSGKPDNEKKRMSGFKLMFNMMKMMGNCMKGKNSDFDCHSIMEGMMKDSEGG